MTREQMKIAQEWYFDTFGTEFDPDCILNPMNNWFDLESAAPLLSAGEYDAIAVAFEETGA